jgi:GDP-mannose 6-dehydrogenase
MVNAGRAPFYEPGLEEVVAGTVSTGFLTASTSMSSLADADVTLICVGTPSAKNGNLGLEQLSRVVVEIREQLASRTNPRQLIVAVRSTVFPGTCEEVVGSILGSDATVVSNPEFLREGTAMKDFLQPSLLVVGGDDEHAVRFLAGLYSPLPVEPCLVSLRTAEMIKYACNAFHAVKISFANEIGSLAGSLGVDAQEVMETLCRDHILNISKAYLKPGFAFGGSCLPKDLRALSYRAGALGIKLPMLESVLPSNNEHLRRTIDDVMELPSSRIGVFGLAFKENTDDLRESPVITLLEHLIGKGRNLRVFDPHIQLDNIYGSNQRFLMEAIPHIGKLMAKDLESLLEWADAIVVTQKPSAGARDAIAASGLPVLDVATLNSVTKREEASVSPV